MNPNLVDIPSSGGLMQVRGREERMSFVEDFEEIYHFRLLYRLNQASLSAPPILPSFRCVPLTKTHTPSLSLSLTLSHCLSYDSQEAVFSPDIWVLAVRWAGEGLRGVQEGGEERHRDGGKGGEVLLHEVIRQSAWPSPNHRLHLHVRVLLISLGNHCKTRQDKTNQTLR